MYLYIKTVNNFVSLSEIHSDNVIFVFKVVPSLTRVEVYIVSVDS